MLTRIIVSSYAVLIEIALWLFLIGCIAAGWHFGNGFVGALVGLALGFIAAVMFFGAFLVLEDIRKFVKSIESKQ